MKQIVSNTVEETKKLGESIARFFKAGDIVCLIGDLGAGKTTFVKGVAKGLKLNPDAVHSPTFVLMNIHEGKLPLYHFDVYRLETDEEMSHLGLEEFLYGEGIAMIEWADRMGEQTPKEFLEVQLIHNKSEGRKIKFKAKGDRYKQLLKQIEGKLAA